MNLDRYLPTHSVKELPKFARDKGESLQAFNRYTETIWNLIRHDAQQALLEGEDG